MLKGTERILNNPYSILGLPCNAKRLDIIRAQEKLNKLANIGAEKTYKTEFVNNSWPNIDRSTGIIQSSISRIAEPTHRLFWFVDPYYVRNYGVDDIKNEFLNKDDLHSVKYDCFLSNYLFLIIEDAQFNQYEYWNKILCFMDFILSCDLSTKKDILATRYSDLSDTDVWNSALQHLSKYIMAPIEELTDNTDSSLILRVLSVLGKRHAVEFDQLRNILLEQLVDIAEISISETDEFFKTIDNMNKIPKSKLSEAANNANQIIDIGKTIITPLLNLFLQESIYLERIKDVFYSEIMKYCNMFAYNKYFINAYNCAAYAKIYAPVHKSSEISKLVEFYSELKEMADVVDQGFSEGQLNIKDKRLIESEDIQVSVLAYKAICGDAESQYRLGSIYKTPINKRKMPIDIPYDLAEAVRWLTYSAEYGSADGQLALGMCYITGEGVNRDFSIADMWIQESVAKGNKEAIEITSDYRYISIKENLGKSNVGRSKRSNYAWIWWVLGIILLIYFFLGI